MLTKRWTLGLAVAAVLLAGAPAAQAATPEPCGGALLIPDAAGDQQFKANGQDTGIASASNTDTGGLFFRVYDGKVTANVVMEDLSVTPPDGFSAIRYRVYYNVGDTTYFLQALAAADGVAYSYGEALPTLSYTKLGDTTGTVFEGKKGVLQIVLPAEAGGTPGTTVDLTSASIGLLVTGATPEEAHLPPEYHGVDTAPDAGADGPATTPVSCDAPAKTGGETTTPPPSTTTPPPSSTPAPSSPSASPTPAFKLTLSGAKVSAKKANKNKSFAVKLNCSQKATQVTVKLKKGSKVVASAKRGSLDGSATVKLKTVGKLKKGAHTLTVTGKKADGSAFSVSFAVKVAG